MYETLFILRFRYNILSFFILLVVSFSHSLLHPCRLRLFVYTHFSFPLHNSLCIYLLSVCLWVRARFLPFVVGPPFSPTHRVRAHNSLFTFEGEIGICSVRCCEDDPIEVTNAHLFECATHINIGSIVVLETVVWRCSCARSAATTTTTQHWIGIIHFDTITFPPPETSCYVLLATNFICIAADSDNMCLTYIHTHAELRCQNNYRYFVANHFTTLFMYSHDFFSLTFTTDYRTWCLLSRSNYQMSRKNVVCILNSYVKCSKHSD